MTTQEKLAALAQRAIPFLRDEGARWADDGSNEPLELARAIEEALSEHGGGGEAVAWRIFWSPNFPDQCEVTTDRERVEKCRACDGQPRIEPLYTTPLTPSNRELIRRLYVELLWCDRQLVSRGCKQGGSVRDVLADALSFLKDTPPTQSAPVRVQDAARRVVSFLDHANLDTSLLPDDMGDALRSLRAALTPPAPAAEQAPDPFPSLRELVAEWEQEGRTDSADRLRAQLDAITGDDIRAMVHARQQDNLRIASEDDATQPEARGVECECRPSTLGGMVPGCKKCCSAAPAASEDGDFMQELAEVLDSNPDRDSILATIDSLKDMVRTRRLAAFGQGVEDMLIPAVSPNGSDEDMLKYLDELLAVQGTLMFARGNYNEDQAETFGVAILDFMRLYGMRLRARLTGGQGVE